MKLNEAVSWFMGTWQRHLFPRLEESWERPLTGKERQLVASLEKVPVDRYAPPASPQRFGWKSLERKAIARLADQRLKLIS